MHVVRKEISPLIPGLGLPLLDHGLPQTIWHSWTVVK